MSVAADGNNLLLGRGELYFDRFDPTTGLSTGLRFLGNVTKIECTPSVEKKEKYGSTTAAAVKIASIITTQTHELAIDMDEYVPENVALALLGTVGALTQAATAVVDEVVSTNVDHTNGKIYQTAHRKIGSVSAKKSPSTALAAGVDYNVLDAEAGLIQVIPGGSILADGDTLLVSYTPTAITGTALPKISAGAVGRIQGHLLFIGRPANGPTYECDIWRANINPNGALGFITDDFASIPLTGEVLQDPAHAGELWRLLKRA